MRAAAELEKCGDLQIVWVLTPSTGLCAQQHEAFKRKLPGYQHLCLRGSDGVDKWKRQSIWDAVLKNVRVVTSTPQVLLDALSHGFIRLSKIALLVFDEAHRATGDSPMHLIMKDFYHYAPTGDRPAVLCLTASPADLETLERIMNATVKTPRLCRADLAKYVHRAKLELIHFGPDLTHYYAPLSYLQDHLLNYDLMTDPYVVALSRDGLCVDDHRVRKVLTKGKTHSTEQLAKIVNKTKEVLHQLGPFGADWNLRECLRKLAGKELNSFHFDLSSSERRHLASILHECLRKTEPIVEPLGDASTTKFAALLDLLDEGTSPHPTVLIFAKQRATVAALAHQLSVHPRTGSRFRIGAYAGAASLARRNDIYDHFNLEDQQKALDDFRSKPGGLLVASSAAEEGIDVPACNFVVCYDEPDNVVSYVQRRGRARKEASKYMMFASVDSANIKKFQALEEVMQKTYESDRMRLELELELELLKEHSSESFVIPRTGAKLTHENATQQLVHFTQSISSEYASGQPEFTFERHSTDVFTADVHLPNSLPSELRKFSGGSRWGSQRDAKRDACFVAVRALYQAGLIDDHLLPLLADDAETVEIDKQCPSMIEVEPRIDPMGIVSGAYDRGEPIQEVCIRLDLRLRQLEMAIMVPQSTPLPQAVELFGRGAQVIKATWSSMARANLEQSDNQLRAKYYHFSRIAMSTAIPKRIESSYEDLAIPFMPVQFLADDVSSIRLSCLDRRSPASNYSSIQCDEHETGLVFDERLPDSKFVFKDIRMAVPTPVWTQDGIEHEDAACLCVYVSKFPKQMYGLTCESSHIIPPKEPAMLDLPVQYCSIGALPVHYVEFVRMYPALIHHWEPFILAEKLRNTLLAPLKMARSSLVIEAISAPSARLPRNYERLEFLGDRLLKLVTALHLMAAYTHWPERYLSRKRDQLVNNAYLTTNALAVGLDRFVTTVAFSGGKWRPTYLHHFDDLTEDKPRVLSTKTIADVVEAVIGACFIEQRLDSESKSASSEAEPAALEAACLAVNTLLPDAKICHVDSAVNILCETAKSQRNTLAQVPQDLKRMVDHEFFNDALLLTAVTHPSSKRDGSSSYDRLEFLGDAILDHIVTVKLFDSLQEMPPALLHTSKSCLVNRDYLAYICLSWAIDVEREAPVLAPGSNHSEQDPVFNIEVYSSSQPFWTFMRHHSSEIAVAQRAVKQRFDAHRDTIREALEHGMSYPWSALTELHAPKFFSDMIEAVLGAVYVDTRGDMRACEALLATMGITSYLNRTIVEARTLTLLHPKERLHILAPRSTVTYTFERVEPEDEGDDAMTRCSVLVDDVNIASVVRGAMGNRALEVLVAAEAVETLQAAKIVTGQPKPEARNATTPHEDAASVSLKGSEEHEKDSEEVLEDSEEEQTHAGQLEAAL